VVSEKVSPYRVERGVALPETRSCFPFLDMAKGDSFFVPCVLGDAAGKQKSISSSAGRFERKNIGCKFTTRIVEGGVRCWRVR
jgi:hypothetical protein